MKKEIIISICATIFVIILGIGAWIFTHPRFDKSNPITLQSGDNGEYRYILYEGREYVPYCAISPKARDKYIGYVGNDKQDEVYTYIDHSEKEWLISYLDSGMMNDCMLLKEKNVKSNPDGLTSEYEWNK